MKEDLNLNEMQICQRGRDQNLEIEAHKCLEKSNLIKITRRDKNNKQKWIIFK